MFNLLIFAAIWLVLIYLVDCWVARKFIKPKVDLTIYVLTMIALGLFGEFVYDSAYHAIFGQPLWLYHVLPIHGGFTSLYSLFLWGMIGFHLYLLHGSLEQKRLLSLHKLALIFCIEAIIIEAAVNITYLLCFGNYIYYYLPSDLLHITSLQTLPLYLLAGYITVLSFKLATNKKLLAVLGNSTVILTILVTG